MLLLALACAKDTPQAKPADLKPGPAAPAMRVEVPEDAARLRALLEARHPSDLPDKGPLDAAGAPEPLVWLAQNDAVMVIRERALLSLQHYGDSASQGLCRQILGSDAHAKLRAASVTCLAGSDLMADSTLRNQLLAALRDADPRVGVAAARVLVEVPAARSGLKAALEDTLQDEVRSIVVSVQ